MHESPIPEPFLQDDVGHPVQDREVGTGPDRQVDRGEARQLDLARIDNDQGYPPLHKALHRQRSDRVLLRGIRSDDQQRLRLLQIFE